MQARYADAETRFRAASHRLGADAGLLMDRLRYLRDGGNEQMARALAAQPHNFTHRPADAERWLEMLLILANGAAADRQWSNRLQHRPPARRRACRPAPILSKQPLGVRDDYTSLAWLAGRTALDRLNRPANAMAMFDRYSRGGKSLQVLTKGQYWAARAALAARQPAQANAYLTTAAGLSRAVLRPARARAARPRGAGAAAGRRDPAGRPRARRLCRQPPGRRRPATRSLTAARRSARCSPGRSANRSTAHSERVLAMELSRQISRPDIAVWVARGARNNGAMFYVRDAYPTHQASVPANIWSLAHGITRQESSFDRYAVSHAGARGLMQLMPGTAREQAGKLGVGYDPGRITDPSYNVLLGSAYFQRMLNTWGGSVPLAVASYNAGPGNVRKWINAYGDPRTRNVDVVGWIEAIPFAETKGYVQRVIENSVVYDQLNPASRPTSRLHVSTYLGKSYPG